MAAYLPGLRLKGMGTGCEGNSDNNHRQNATWLNSSNLCFFFALPEEIQSRGKERVNSEV